MVRRITESREPGKPGLAASDEAFQSSYPELYGHLVELVWPDGKTRQTSSLMVFCEDGCWKAMLNNRAEGMVTFVTASTFLELVDLVDHGLAEGTLDWRKSKVWKKGG